MRLTGSLFSLAAIVLLTPAQAVADVTPIKVDPQKGFKHAPSGMVLAAAAAGIPRTAVAEYDNQQLDVAAEYRSADDQEITTIFVFRKVTGDVPLWFDRIQRTVEARENLASPTLAIPPAPFIPAGQSNARGLRAVYVAGGPPWKSSAAALTAAGDWFVAVRASSQTLPPDQLLTRLEQTFASIKWPREKAAAPDAYVVANCPAALPQGPLAEPVDEQGADVMASALMGNLGGDLEGAGVSKPPRWCRDPFKVAGSGIYRPDGATDRYFVAFQDAGRGIMVQPNGLAGLLAGAKSEAPLTYMVELIGIDRRSGIGSFKTLPNFAQAIWLNEHGKVTYTAGTWGKKRAIEINSDLFK